MVLVFDVGATHTRVSLCEGGKLGQLVRLDTDASAAGFAKFLGVLEEVAKGHKLVAVAGCFPGQIEGPDGNLEHITNLPKWTGLPILGRLRDMFSCPVYVLNDAELCGLGESHFGAGITSGVMAYFTVSTGVNAVRIVDGAVDRSISHYEIGKLLIDESHGRRESLESLTGGAKLQQRTGKAPRQLRSKSLWKQESRDIATGLYDILITWTPELVVFGGGMVRDVALADVRRDLEKLPPVLGPPVVLKYAKLGDLAGLHGALVWLQQVGRSA